ncbi:NUDIX domain-containing protein [Actinoalloteichus sp. GBA129-24]|uniref:NUDIX domain-containing protein n=1 Tax=Actinoalloteichus sp. GBA129-24 TaxID=1612551 RepID=UPI0009503ADA|nr:NUDIX domain-containing protein [Actinoalloteichus sp. GBA129-24]APU18921.1 ADP-ribose pyrophosphatase [Actinoalloteichus sp. GBA129-24]
MPLLRTSTLIEAEPPTVAAALRMNLEAARTEAAGVRIETAGGRALLGEGDLLSFDVPTWLGARVPVRTRLTTVRPTELRAEAVPGSRWQLDHRITLAVTGAGTLLTESLRWSWTGGALDGLLDAVAARRMILRLFAARETSVRAVAGRLRDAEVVVGAAVLRGATVLAAQRAKPSSLAGRWELPGGSVESGETEQDAVKRECREELGVRVRVGARIGPDLPLRDGRVLRIYLAQLEKGQAPAPDRAKYDGAGSDGPGVVVPGPAGPGDGGQGPAGSTPVAADPAQSEPGDLAATRPPAGSRPPDDGAGGAAARPEAAEPEAREHRELRWLPADRLGEVDWLPADLDVLPDLGRLLTERAARRRTKEGIPR